MSMKLETHWIDPQTLQVSLQGRLDVAGALEIDAPFTAAAVTQCARVVVDLAETSFIASIGIRTLVSSAKALAVRGGRMVLMRPGPDVRRVLETAGIDQIIPIRDDLAGATAALGSA